MVVLRIEPLDFVTDGKARHFTRPSKVKLPFYTANRLKKGPRETLRRHPFCWVVKRFREPRRR